MFSCYFAQVAFDVDVASRQGLLLFVSLLLLVELLLVVADLIGLSI